jgi:hypothetical protein
MALPAEHATTNTMPSILVIIVSLPGQVDEIEDCRKHALCVTGNQLWTDVRMTGSLS